MARPLARALMGARHEVVFFVPYAGPLLTGVGATGGAETQLVLIARALAQRGRRAALAVFDVPGLPASMDGAAIVALPRPPSGKGRTRLVAGLLRIDAGVFVQRAAGSYTGVVGLAARARQRRFVYSSASDFDFEPTFLDEDAMARRLFGIGIRCAQAIVVQTDAQAALCRRAWGREGTVIRSLAEPASPRSGEPEAFVWAGRMAAYKRPEVFAQLAARLPRARFWMVGEPSEWLRALAADAPNLELLGSRPRTELLALIDRAVAVVSTSVKEGMPNVFLEGWARGVPALALSHDPDGLIERHRLGSVAGGSLDRLAELAGDAWDGRDRQAAVAARCREYIGREHAPDEVAARWERVLGL